MPEKDPMEVTGGMKAPTAGMRRRTALAGFPVILIISLCLHGSAFGGYVYFQSLKPKPVVRRASIPVELVRLGKPRDPKLLPRNYAPAAPPPDEGINLDTGSKSKPSKKRRKRTERKMSDAARRLLEGADSKLDSAVANIDDEPEGSPDGSIYGTTSDASRAASGYEARIGAAMRSKYSLPQTIPASQRRFLTADIDLWIGPDGRILKYSFSKSHPNKVFMSSLENLLKTTKLPAPPPALAQKYRTVGVTLRFKP